MNEQTPFCSRIKPTDPKARSWLAQQVGQQQSPQITTPLHTAQSDSLQVLRAIAIACLETASQIATQEAKASGAVSWWAKRFTNYIFRFLIHASVLPQALEAMMTEHDFSERAGADRIAALRWKIALRCRKSTAEYDTPLTIEQFKTWSHEAQKDVLFLVENAQSQHVSREQRENCEDAIRRLQSGQENVGIDVSIAELIASYNKLTQKERERITPEDVRAMTPTERYKALLLISHEAHLLVGEERALLNELSNITSPANICALDRIRAYKLERLLVQAFMRLSPAVQQLFNEISTGELSMLDPSYQQLVFELAKEKVAKYGTTCQRVHIEQMTTSAYDQIAEVLSHYLTIEEKAIVCHAITRPLGLGQLLPEEIKTLQFQLERLLEDKNDTQAEPIQQGLDFLGATYNTKRKETHGDELCHILDRIEPHNRRVLPSPFCLIALFEAYAQTDIMPPHPIVHFALPSREPPPSKTKNADTASWQHLPLIQVIDNIAERAVEHAQENEFYTTAILQMTEHKAKLDAASIVQDILSEVHNFLPAEPKVIAAITAQRVATDQLYHSAAQAYMSLQSVDPEALMLYMKSQILPALPFFLRRVVPKLKQSFGKKSPWHMLAGTKVSIDTLAAEALSVKERKRLLEVTRAHTIAEACKILATHSPLDRLTLHPAFFYALDKPVQKKIIALVQEYGTKEAYETVNDLVAEYVALTPYRRQKAKSMYLSEWQELDATEQERILFVVSHAAGFRDLVDDDADRIVHKYMRLPTELTCGISCTSAKMYLSKSVRQQAEIRLSNAQNCSFVNEEKETAPLWEYEQFLQLKNLEPKKLKKILALYGALSCDEQSIFTPDDVRKLSPAKRAHMAALAHTSETDAAVIAHLFNRLPLQEQQKLLTMLPEEDGDLTPAEYYTAQDMQQAQKSCIQSEAIQELVLLDSEAAKVKDAIGRLNDEEYIPLGYTIHRLKHDCSALQTQIEAKQSVAQSIQQALFGRVSDTRQHKLQVLLNEIDTDTHHLARLQQELEENKRQQKMVSERLQRALEREDEIEQRRESIQHLVDNTTPKQASIAVRTVHAIEQLMDTVLREVYQALEEALFEQVETSGAFEFQKRITSCRERIDQLIARQKQKLSLLRRRVVQAEIEPYELVKIEQFEIRLAACMIQHLSSLKNSFEERLGRYIKKMDEDMQLRQEQLKALLEQSKQLRPQEAL